MMLCSILRMADAKRAAHKRLYEGLMVNDHLSDPGMKFRADHKQAIRSGMQGSSISEFKRAKIKELLRTGKTIFLYFCAICWRKIKEGMDGTV